MPTYEFRCPDGHEFDRFHKTMSAAPMELPCPECGAVASRQMSGGAGLVFKGSGFYLTDYGKNAHRGGAPGKEGDGAKEGAKADGAKSESGKSEGGKAEGGKAEGGKPESAPAKGESKGGEKRSESAKAERNAPSGQSPRPKAESPKRKKSE